MSVGDFVDSELLELEEPPMIVVSYHVSIGDKSISVTVSGIDKADIAGVVDQIARALDPGI